MYIISKMQVFVHLWDKIVHKNLNVTLKNRQSKKSWNKYNINTEWTQWMHDWEKC